jgi:hypothetical protein
MDNLWGRKGKRAWQYLEEQPGLTEASIVAAGLGYIPGGYREWQAIEGLRVPFGITIPWMARGVIRSIKVRHAVGEQRYQQVGLATSQVVCIWVISFSTIIHPHYGRRV